MTTKIREEDAPKRVRDAWNQLGDGLVRDGIADAPETVSAARALADAYYQWGRDDSDRAAIHGLAKTILPEPQQLSTVDDQRAIDKWLGVLIVGGTYLVLLLAIVIVAAHRWLW